MTQRNPDRDAEANKHFEQFLAYHDRGELDSAWDEIEKAIRIDPRYVGSFGYLGKAYESIGNLSKAIASYKEFLKYASLEQNRGEFEQVIDLYPNKISELEKALKHFELSQPLSPEQQKALFVSVTKLALFADGLKSSMQPDRFGKTILTEVSPEIAEWALPYARLIQKAEDNYRAGHIINALDDFRRIQFTLPDAAIILMNIGVCYAEIGNKIAARSWLQKALRVIPLEYSELVHENLQHVQ